MFIYSYSLKCLYILNENNWNLKKERKEERAVIEVYFKDFFLAFQILQKKIIKMCVWCNENREINLHDYSHKNYSHRRRRL